MAPIILPPAQSEKFTISGTGLHTLTQQQRNSRQLSFQIEKVKNSTRNFYFNFRIPEPSSFWGYVQTVSFDTVIDTFELKFRRQSIIRWDTYELESIEQLRCLIKESTLLLFDTATNFYIANGADPALLGQDRANYLLNVGQPRLIPTIPITGIYYEIDGNFLGQVTTIWQDYAAPCANPAGNQILPPPRGPGAGESGNNSGGGGGTRPALPPPPDRTSDPDSDSPAPPPDSPSGPPSPSPTPPPAPSNYRITWNYTVCTRQIATGQFAMETSGNITQTGPGPFTTSSQSQNGTPSVGIRDASGNYTAGVTGAAVSVNPCNTPAFVTIVNQSVIP
jgi:hypothetical protein